ncbi:MAG: exodeoxyribonuclease V subunit alpha [Actinobacteria bacterium]|nr:exodeoxyribonuclease V subunit alpha [Actinomycetota bacterium]
MHRVPGPLAPFVAAGVLAPADVHTATTLCRLGGDDRPEVLLAVALAVRGPRLGHVCIDLTTVRDTVLPDEDAPVDPDTLSWPDPELWQAAVEDSPLTGDADDRPLRVHGGRLYLDRYWRYERRVVDALRRHAAATVADVDDDGLGEALDRLFGAPRGDAADRQRAAATLAVRRRLAVIAGGPGTGKTYTIARVLTLLHEQHRGARDLRVALVAPTGKAAARMEEEIHAAAGSIDTDEDTRAALVDAEASTIHRLLRVDPGNRSRFRHDRDNPLPHDVVVCDETSMVSLALMAKLLEALRPETRLILVGDPEQLASVEAGAVLGDIVGPATGGAATGIGSSIAVLTRVHRFSEDSGIAALARAIQSGHADAAVDVLSSGRPDLRWLDVDADASADDRVLRPLRDLVVDNGRRCHAAARSGDAAGALLALTELRVLCAHRRGPHGVASWVPLIERWLARGVDGYDPSGLWYLAQPVLVTRNDHRLGIFNGDIGVVVAGEDGLTIAFEGAEGPRRFGPTRLEATETVHAMTIHKSQGSQFLDVVVVLPDATSPILTRELLYTGVTRGQRSATVVGTADAVRAAVERRVQRASGLGPALWETADGSAAPAG